MLVKNIPRGQGQCIRIGDDVVVNIGRATDGQIKLAVQAPKSVKITLSPTTDSKPVE